MMDIITIRHRLTGAIWSGKEATLRGAVERAVREGYNLDDADLNCASLVGANLEGANLEGANLNCANLNCANLEGASLIEANLVEASLVGTNLEGASLVGANLEGANLIEANLEGASLVGANLNCANLVGAYRPKRQPSADIEAAGWGYGESESRLVAVSDAAKAIAAFMPAPRPAPGTPALSREERATRRKAARHAAMMRYRERHPDVPVVEHLDAKILAASETGVIRFDMSRWHGDAPCGDKANLKSCGTTHCRAGSAIHLAGEAGYALERKLDNPAQAGRAIYMASTGRSPWFFDPSSERAMADIRRCAAEDAEGGRTGA